MKVCIVYTYTYLILYTYLINDSIMLMLMLMRFLIPASSKFNQAFIQIDSPVDEGGRAGRNRNRKAKLGWYLLCTIDGESLDGYLPTEYDSRNPV